LGTGGAAPALTRALRERLEAMLDDELGQWLALLALMRPMILAKVTDPERRRQLWEELCGEQWIERLKCEGLMAVQAAVVRLVETIFLAVQRPPLGWQFGLLLVLSWILAVFYLFGAFHHTRQAWGIFILPVILVLVGLATVFGPPLNDEGGHVKGIFYQEQS